MSCLDNVKEALGRGLMPLEEWFNSKLKEYENDLGFQRERLLYLLGERIAERLEHAHQVGR